MLSGGALYATWTEEINMLEINAQSILAVLGSIYFLFPICPGLIEKQLL